jgi:hypothetical protein
MNHEDKINLIREKCIAPQSGKAHPNYRHGQAGTRLYKKWEGMKRRCLNPMDYSYPRYGGRGITVSKSWMRFDNFFRDMGPAYRIGMSLERRDNNKGYSRSNCKWIPLAEQGKNRRTVKLYVYRGERMTIQDWARKVRLRPDTIYRRLTHGWSVRKAISILPSLGNKYLRNKPLSNGKVK